MPHWNTRPFTVGSMRDHRAARRHVWQHFCLVTRNGFVKDLLPPLVGRPIAGRLNESGFFSQMCLYLIFVQTSSGAA